MQVILRPIRTANELWMPAYRTIVIKSGMRAVHQRNALAHGIGHADLGHVDDRPKYEHQADRYASLYLIDPMEFREIALWSDDLDKMAAELNVTRRLLSAYLGWAS